MTQDLPQRLNDLADDMEDLAIAMKESRNEHIRFHGFQLKGASEMARTWATGIEAENEQETSQHSTQHDETANHVRRGTRYNKN